MSPAYLRDDQPHLRPGPTQPGTLLEQLRAVGIFYALPPRIRGREADGGWQRARRAAMPHTRRPTP